MSYARFGCDGSDVYVYAGSVGIECCGCALSADETDPAPMSHDQAIAHLRLHVAAGQRVPEFVFERLAADRDQYPPTESTP